MVLGSEHRLREIAASLELLELRARRRELALDALPVGDRARRAVGLRLRRGLEQCIALLELVDEPLCE